MTDNREAAENSRPSLFRRGLSFVGFMMGMALLGFLAQFQWVGHIVIVLYAVAAFWFRMPARTAFIAALLALAMVPVAIILANWVVAQNFAAYTFVLFVVGVLIMVVDLKREVQPGK